VKKQLCIALLLAGGKGKRLSKLTKNVVKPAVPFGGKYRIIDFTLSNCRNSNIDTIGILTQYKPHLLHSYLGNGRHWNLDAGGGGLTLLPPYQSDEGDVKWYEGTSHAVFQNIDFVDQYRPEHVLILSGDHIYKMDYRMMLKQHIQTNADATVSVVGVPWEDANRFGIMKLDHKTRRITDFEEKPSKPLSNLASMGVYIFKWSMLKQYIVAEEQKKFTSRDFGKNIIPSMMNDKANMYGYYFTKYWRDVGTVESYWEANLDLLNKKKNIFMQNPDWNIYTAHNNEPPVYLDSSAKIHHSIVNEGCEIYGEINNSVLFNGVKVGTGAIIKNSVILPHTVVKDNAYIENAVIGSDSLIQYGITIQPKQPTEHLYVVGNNQVVEYDVARRKAIG